MQPPTEKLLRERARREPLEKRARNLGLPGATANGIKMVEVVSLNTADNRATLRVHFFNDNSINEITANSTRANLLFPITGGQRIPAGSATGQVQVISILAHLSASTVLQLELTPIGDYSTYTLSLNTSPLAPAVFDPLFAEISFKFRPGCFNVNCAPDWETAPPAETAPAIDYLAKDYDSFRHTMITAMMQRVPGWQPTSEADLDQVLLNLFAAAADELSDFQDRVMNEAYLSSARKRVSLARHARLMDYHIHQGNQAGTWLALELATSGGFDLTEGLKVWAGNKDEDASSVVYISRHAAPQHVHSLLNRLGLYTWDDAIPSLVAGSTSADLAASDEASARTVANLIRDGKIEHLLIQEHLNPATGAVAGYDPRKRQLLRLPPNAEALRDPIRDKWFVRMRWREEDALRHSYCFTVDCKEPVGKVENVSLFHGNLIEVHHGRPRWGDPLPLLAREKFYDDRKVVFKDPRQSLADHSNWLHYERTACQGVTCTLPDRDLAYLDTPPGGEAPPFSTLKVTVTGWTDPWDEVPSLIHSDDGAESGDHFVVETDEVSPDGGRRSRLRFGNGVNGRELPDGAVVHCEYQVGQGAAGNIGADKLDRFDPKTPLAAPVRGRLLRCWNPFDATNGRAPEPAMEIVRRVPEAYRARQLRAVTLRDYVERAQEISEVSRAAASYAWTGSWRTVRLTIDPVGTNELSDELRRQVARHLEAVRLIGEDLEIRPPRFTPLRIYLRVCALPDYWPEDLKFVLEQELSSGWTPDGRRGFFHPDRWTFGQPLHASQLLGRVHSVVGVEHVISLAMKRWNDSAASAEVVGNLRHNEIIQVRNDPNHVEQGWIEIEVLGGRR